MIVNCVKVASSMNHNSRIRAAVVDVEIRAADLLAGGLIRSRPSACRCSVPAGSILISRFTTIPFAREGVHAAHRWGRALVDHVSAFSWS